MVLKAEEQNNVEKTLIRNSYRHGLFKSPNTLSIKMHLEEMASLSNQLMPKVEIGATI